VRPRVAHAEHCLPLPKTPKGTIVASQRPESGECRPLIDVFGRLREEDTMNFRICALLARRQVDRGCIEYFGETSRELGNP
jgi:hypothetical protein